MKVTDSEPTREKILNLLRKNGQVAVSDLAAMLGITHIAVRHHLNALQNENLVEAREEHHGIGRPRMQYRLTETAMERNPSKYFTLTNMLLEQLKQQLPAEMVERFFTDIASQMADDLRAKLAGLPLEQRLERLVELLEQEGYVARVESVGPDQYRLTELTCPYRKISLHHPEVCRLDESLISGALGASVAQESCLRTGSTTCTFAIAARNAESK
jgi:DeoR family transcriptional regulator, suf operon transcriptional repressor